MYSFTNDYSEGAHKNILAALIKTNFEQTDGYGTDKYCKEAEEIIKNYIGNFDSSVHFLSGGTATNTAFISASLRAHEGVIAPSTAHINVHETGSIESTGHKIMTIEEVNGKIYADGIREMAKAHFEDEAREHTVKPKMVYISNPTELGTIYSKEELCELREVCDEYGMYLYVDGARLGSALTCVDNDVTMEDLGKLTDAFYIGGTKMGAMFGEALVINNKELNVDFRYHIKQNGAMIAKGRLMGVQFIELFKDGLYFEIGKHENRLANKLTLGIGNLGYGFYSMSATNQVFPILPNDILKVISKKYAFEIWEKLNEEKSVIRLCTSFATSEKMVDQFLKDLAKLTIAKEKLMKEITEKENNNAILDENNEENIIQPDEIDVNENVDAEGSFVSDLDIDKDESLSMDITEDTSNQEQDMEEDAFEEKQDEVLPVEDNKEYEDIENTEDVKDIDDVISEEVNEIIDETEEEVKPVKKKAVVEEFVPMETFDKDERIDNKVSFEDIFASEKDYTVESKDDDTDNKVKFEKDSDMDFFSEFEFED